MTLRLREACGRGRVSGQGTGEKQVAQGTAFLGQEDVDLATVVLVADLPDQIVALHAVEGADHGGLVDRHLATEFPLLLESEVASDADQLILRLSETFTNEYAYVFYGNKRINVNSAKTRDGTINQGKNWQRRMGVEPTRGRAKRPLSRFEDGETHRGPYTSMLVCLYRLYDVLCHSYPGLSSLFRTDGVWCLL